MSVDEFDINSPLEILSLEHWAANSRPDLSKCAAQKSLLLAAMTSDDIGSYNDASRE